MRNAFSFLALAGLGALVVAGCTGGSAGSSSAHIRCAGGESFCIISCDLGCTQTGCAVNEIAENQRLKFNFSQDLDADSINPASFSIRTVTGETPEGDVTVEGNVLTFTPRVRTVGGISTFGFLRNQTYLIAMPGGVSGSFGLTNTAGDRLSHEFLCTVIATRGIVDEDQQAPSVVMVAPTNTSAAPRDPTIILRFSELIDTTPLRGMLTAASPVRFTLHTASTVGGALVCDSETAGLTLEGIPTLRTERLGSADVTVLEFKPTVLLPGQACVTIDVTADLRDLSGRAAIPAHFEFLTEAGVVFPIDFVETFDTEDKRDGSISSGVWNGVANAGLLGEDGRHGSFDYTLGTPLSASIYEWDTTSIVIPAAYSSTGLEYTVTDGKFYFTDFNLPDGITVNFAGPVPPKIWVRGSANIAGVITLNGAPMTRFNSRGTTLASGPAVPGQPGGAPGPGGGFGGAGADECGGAGPGTGNLFDGNSGDDVQVPAGHAYLAQAASTGGNGSLLNPPDGLINNTITQPLISNLYRVYLSPGGSGGGFSAAGGLPSSSAAPAQIVFGATPSASLVFDMSTMTIPVGVSSLDFYQIGGSGGGGGGSHNYGTLWPASFDAYMAGAGGSGGGGVMALRVGGDLLVSGSGLLEAKGGAGVQINGKNANNTTPNADWGICSPGGGGSGGSLLLQAGGDLDVLGTLDAGGGGGSTVGGISGTTAVLNLNVGAGAGAPGFYRLEAGGSLTVGSAQHVPAYAAANSGTLLDRDSRAGCTSTWYDSQQVFPPAWLRYELDVDDGSGTVVTYTDSGDPGAVLANDPNGPVMVMFQGATMEQGTGLPFPASIGEWRFGIGSSVTSGISLDSPTGFRFRLEFNRGLFPNAVVHELRVYARG